MTNDDSSNPPQPPDSVQPAGCNAKQPTGRIAGIDYGTVRVGIAISDTGRSIASPYENYTRQDDEQDANRFQRLVDEESITLFVVGLPIHLDGRESQKSNEARRYAQWIQKVTGVDVELYDERFSSAAAETLLLDAQFTKKRRKKRLDMIAAQILLSAFLEAGCPRGQDQNQSLDDRQ